MSKGGSQFKNVTSSEMHNNIHVTALEATFQQKYREEVATGSIIYYNIPTHPMNQPIGQSGNKSSKQPTHRVNQPMRRSGNKLSKQPNIQANKQFPPSKKNITSQQAMSLRMSNQYI